MITPVGIDVLRKGFAELYKSSKHSDCKIECGSYTFHAHKAVICSQSVYFDTALKSGTFKEGETGVVKLAAAHDGADSSDVCDDPEIVRSMIEYFYLFDYGTQLSDETSRSAATSPPSYAESYLIEHAKVFAMAIKYQADGLSELAAAKFKTAVTTHGHWQHEDFPAAVSVVYNSTPDDVLDLRQVVEDVLHKRFDTLKANAEMVAIVRGIEGLTYSLLDRRSTMACSQEQCLFTIERQCSRCHRKLRYCISCSEAHGASKCTACGWVSTIF